MPPVTDPPPPLPGSSLAPDVAPSGPASLADLFWSFTFLALQGFGGVLAIVQRELVEKKRWLTRDEFLEDWAVAQILPGPNVGNLALMIGARSFGWRGAVSALSGMLLFPMIMVLLLAALYAGIADLPAARGALRGMGAIAAGLITATGLKLIAALQSNPMGPALCVVFASLTFVAVALLRIPLLWVLLVLGSIATGWAWRCLRLREAGIAAPSGTP